MEQENEQTAPEGQNKAGGRRRKSLFVAFLLWFFLGIIAAHKIYLRKYREAAMLLLAYFLIPLAAVMAVVFGLMLWGIEIVPPSLGPEEMAALVRDPKFLAVTGVALLALTAVWIWDFTVLMRQVREYNQKLKEDTSQPEGE